MKSIILFLAIAVISTPLAQAEDVDIWQTFVVRANSGIGASKLAPKPKSFLRHSEDFSGNVTHFEVNGYQDISSYIREDGMKVITVHTYSRTTSYSYKVRNYLNPRIVVDPKGPQYSYVGGHVPMNPSKGLLGNIFRKKR